jgi:hypothetical protein
MATRLERSGPPVAGPIPERVFRYLVELETEKALWLRYRVSLFSLTPDVESPAAWGVTRQIASLALRRLRRTDVATTFSHGAVGLRLIDADALVLPANLDRAGHAELSGRPRFTCGQHAVSVSGGGSCYPVTAPTGRELLRQAKDLMRQAQEEGGGRLILPVARPAAEAAPLLS